MKEPTIESITAKLREIPITERLFNSREMIGNMCSERRPPKMSIPVAWYDEDFYINTTLRDAEQEIKVKQTRLTLTEHALAAAGELIETMNKTCEVISPYNEKRINKLEKSYRAALSRLDEVTK